MLISLSLSKSCDVLILCMKMGAKATTLTGLSGSGDIMLTCFVNLSRNRTVGLRLGSGESLDNIISSMNQVLENLVCCCYLIIIFCSRKIIWP